MLEKMLRVNHITFIFIVKTETYLELQKILWKLDVYNFSIAQCLIEIFVKLLFLFDRNISFTQLFDSFILHSLYGLCGIFSFDGWTTFLWDVKTISLP